MAVMRLDKFLSGTGLVSRKEASALVKKGAVTIDGIPEKSADLHIDPETQIITMNGTRLTYHEHTYLMMNKPEGYVSATDDPGPYVVSLLPANYQRIGVFPCGRLDKNTVGLLILTDDGPLAHRLLSPARHVDKEYFVRTKFPFSAEDKTVLEAGVTLETGVTTLPCQIEHTGEKEIIIRLREGKYHQIKLMLRAVHNQVTYLERISFGGIPLDISLPLGGFRELTEEEIGILKRQAGG